VILTVYLHTFYNYRTVSFINQYTFVLEFLLLKLMFSIIKSCGLFMFTANYKCFILRAVFGLWITVSYSI